jgi:hypothetical protein
LSESGPRERTELALERADVRVVDVARHESDRVTDRLAAQRTATAVMAKTSLPAVNSVISSIPTRRLCHTAEHLGDR